ncbi:hypothetical protein Y032_0365g3592 [Ancylostoma ceylanicum]|uniref:SCP domain-containing protein n=1 Tax=Ancylostoma ceylanicum TaxID=53326 RepID=A0A016RUX4_9BILA|nr:hypothetical protein Y032_0365g3592 [Ancylostoma ceylanicum]
MQQFLQTLTTCNPKPFFKETVKNWWDVVRTEGLDANPVNKDGLESFAALAHAKATRIGCAQKNCNGVLYLACAIFDKAPEKNQPIYEVGKGCTAATDCTTFAGSRCNTGTNLCVAGYIDPAATTSTAPTSPTTPTASPTTTDTTASTSTTGSTAPTTITASGSTMSTVPPGETTICPNNGHISTDAIRNIYLDLHNLHRSNLARGLVTNGFTHAPARQASKMIKLKYNCTAETSAFAWAQQCKDEDSHTQGVSENRYTFPNRNLDMTASNRWWEEITTKGMSQEDLNIFYSRLGVSHYARVSNFLQVDTRRFTLLRKCTFVRPIAHIVHPDGLGLDSELRLCRLQMSKLHQRCLPLQWRWCRGRTNLQDGSCVQTLLHYRRLTMRGRPLRSLKG